MNTPWKFGATGYTVVDSIGQQVVLLAVTPDINANARLISAAPDLLEALKDAKVFVEASTHAGAPDVLRVVRAAIAKAEVRDVA